MKSSMWRQGIALGPCLVVFSSWRTTHPSKYHCSFIYYSWMIPKRSWRRRRRRCVLSRGQAGAWFGSGWGKGVHEHCLSACCHTSGWILPFVEVLTECLVGFCYSFCFFIMEEGKLVLTVRCSTCWHRVTGLSGSILCLCRCKSECSSAV